MSRLQIGHERNERLQGTHVAKCPHGIQANRLSFVKQTMHGLADVELLDGSVAAFIAEFSVVSLFTDCDEAVSTSVALGGGVVATGSRPGTSKKSEASSRLKLTRSIVLPILSRIISIWMLGITMFSFFPGNVLHLFLTNNLKVLTEQTDERRKESQLRSNRTLPDRNHSNEQYHHYRCSTNNKQVSKSRTNTVYLWTLVATHGSFDQWWIPYTLDLLLEHWSLS